MSHKPSPNTLETRRQVTVSSPTDASEHEADRVADQVMRRPEPAPSEAAAVAIQPERVGSSEPSRESSLVRSGHSNASEVGPDTSTAVRESARVGTPLSDEVRAYFEPRFGRDLGHVRLHTDDSAANAASSVNARAYTLGRDIVFGAGEFDPATSSGKRLLAHELAHVVQPGTLDNQVPRMLQPQERREESARLPELDENLPGRPASCNPVTKLYRKERETTSAENALFARLIAKQQIWKDNPVGFSGGVLLKLQPEEKAILARYGYKEDATGTEDFEIARSLERDFNHARTAWARAGGANYLSTETIGSGSHGDYQGTPVHNEIEAAARAVEESQRVGSAIAGANLGFGAIGYGIDGDRGALLGDTIGTIVGSVASTAGGRNYYKALARQPHGPDSLPTARSAPRDSVTDSGKIEVPARGSVNARPTNFAYGEIDVPTRYSARRPPANARSVQTDIPGASPPAKSRFENETRYRWANPGMKEGNFIDATLENGRLSVTIKAHGPNRRNATQLFNDVFNYFGDKNVKEFEALWVRDSTFADNYSEFSKNMNVGMSDADAAWNTWTGRQLKTRGFSSVEVPPHKAGVVRPVFKK
jgi:hypothetical protein